MKEEYEELKALLRLYYEIYDDDGTVYSDDEWERLLREIEIDIRTAIGFFEEE